MTKRQVQEPLLYIQQPIFEKKHAPMQQSFLIKSRKNKDEEKKESIIEEKTLEKKSENLNNLDLTNIHESIAPIHSNEIEETDETDHTGVLEFILEGILTPGENPEINTEISNEIEQEQVQIIKQSKNNMKQNKKRPHFNQLSLPEKLAELKNLPPMTVKVFYKFILKNNVYSGYFKSFKKGEFLIQLFPGNQTVQISEDSLIDVMITGL